MTKPGYAHLREAERPSIQRAGGARTTQMVTPQCVSCSFLNGFTVIPPKAAIPLHYHNCEESVLVVSGTARVEVDGAFFEAKSGDVTWLPENLPHRFINPSKTVPLRIFWTYGSVNATRTLVESGETGLVVAEHRQDG
ncbi:MAG: cupin domain-containing protein [Rhodobacteraceae bacterium]|nr:cupin domain-containing protein [Paracoccaceae bacterium]